MVAFGLPSSPSVATTTTRSTTLWSIRYASARLVSGDPESTTTGRVGVLSWRERFTISWAPSALLALRLVDLTVGGPHQRQAGAQRDVGDFSSPLARAAATSLAQPVAFAFASASRGSRSR